MGEVHIKMRNNLKEGRYDWFKPIFGTSLENTIIKANKNLQEVDDNGHLVRGQASKKYMKEGKIFTFQANDPRTYNDENGYFVREDIDTDGKPFIEYTFDGEETEKQHWVK